MWLPRRIRLRTLSVAARVMLLGVLLLLAACSTSSPPALKTPPVVFPTSTPTGPQPVSSLLDPAPASCPSTSSLDTKTFQHFGGFPGSVTLYGGSVVWIAGPYFPTVAHLEADGSYNAYPSHKIVWEVGPDFTQTVTVQVTNLATGQFNWWGNGSAPGSGTPLSQTLTLSPDTSGPARLHAPPLSGWQEYGSTVYLTRAGCYAMDVTWPGGSWRSVFAAGR